MENTNLKRAMAQIENMVKKAVSEEDYKTVYEIGKFAENVKTVYANALTSAYDAPHGHKDANGYELAVRQEKPTTEKVVTKMVALSTLSEEQVEKGLELGYIERVTKMESVSRLVSCRAPRTKK